MGEREEQVKLKSLWRTHNGLCLVEVSLAFLLLSSVSPRDLECNPKLCAFAKEFSLTIHPMKFQNCGTVELLFASFVEFIWLQKYKLFKI